MNKWEKLLLLKFRPNCGANCVLSQNERAQKTYPWCQGTRLINFSNKTEYNFLTFVIAGWLTLETKNVLTQIFYLQERNKNEKITLLFMETLACFYETYASEYFPYSQCSIFYKDNSPPPPNPKITFASNFEQNVAWRAVLAKFQAVKNYANP